MLTQNYFLFIKIYIVKLKIQLLTKKKINFKILESNFSIKKY